MISPPIPLNEEERLESIRSLDIMDSTAEESYDAIAQLAGEICQTPIALITILDAERNWFKSKIGTEITETPRDISFCGHAIEQPNDIFEVTNPMEDKRFSNNPLVLNEGGVRFYAGVPINDEKGLPLGTLCVLDSREHHLSESQKISLKALAKQVELLMEYRKKNRVLEQMKNDLDENNRILKEFASTVSHDLKMPLANMIITADILKAKYSSKMDAEGIKYLEYLKHSGLTLSDYINGLLDHYSSSNLDGSNSGQEFFLNDLLEDIIDLLQIDDNCEINLPDNNLKIVADNAALGQIFMNLISNSLKYNSRDKIVIDIDCTENREFFNFSIEDNGIGIPKEKQQRVFDLFATVADKDRRGKKGHGIGLSTVKKLVSRLGGNISVTSEEGKGTCIRFSIRRGQRLD